MLSKPTLDSGIAACVTAPFFIALSILYTKIAGHHSHAFFIAGLGALMSVPFLVLPVWANRTSLGISSILQVPETRNAFLQVLVSRNIVGQALIVLGFTMTTAVKSILLLRLEPVLVFVWSMLLLNERPTKGKLALLGLLLVGSMLTAWPTNPVSAPNLGDGLIVIALLTLSYSYLPTQRVVAKASSNALNLLTNLFGGLALTAMGIACCGIAAIPHTWETIGPIAGYTFSFAIVGVTLYLHALRTVKPWIIASFLSLEVIYGLLLAAVMVSEQPTLMQLLGAIVLLSATVGIALYRKHQEAADAAHEHSTELPQQQSTAASTALH